MIQFIRNIQTIASGLSRLVLLLGNVSNTEKRFDALTVKTDELIIKHNELIQHMTQFFITSEKIKLAEDRRKQEIEKERTATPEDYKY